MDQVRARFPHRRPALDKDAVAREGSSETDSLKVFDYPILASSTLSSDGLRLDAGEHESDDADDVDAEPEPVPPRVWDKYRRYRESASRVIAQLRIE